MSEVLLKQPQNSKFLTSIPANIEKTPIDIIVPTHGRLDLTMKCLNAIYKGTESPFHLIITDGMPISEDDPDALLGEYIKRMNAKYGNITYLRHDTPYKEGNEFFNHALQHCKYEFVATIMNSVTVQPEWDIVAVNFMKNNPRVGIIGLKCLLPTGVIESAGITMMGFTPMDIGRDSPGYSLNTMHECIAVQWAFALLRRVAVEGNLQEGIYHGFAGMDDIDNSFVVRSKGWQIWYCGLGVGVHEFRATRGKDTVDAMLQNRENHEIFYKRWGYWDLYQKANDAKSMQDKSKIMEEVRGLAFTLRAKGEAPKKAII